MIAGPTSRPDAPEGPEELGGRDGRCLLGRRDRLRPAEEFWNTCWLYRGRVSMLTERMVALIEEFGASPGSSGSGPIPVASPAVR